MRESKVETALRKGVEALGGTCEKFTSPGKHGVPDRLICWSVDSGSLLAHGTPDGWGCLATVEFVETKRPKGEGGKLESWQERDHARRRAMGFLVHVIYDLDQVEAYLKSRGKR